MDVLLKSIGIACVLVLFSGSRLHAQEINKSSESEVLEFAEQMPRFPGCETKFSDEEKEACSERKMLMYVYSNVKYPPEAREEGISGTVQVEFVIGKEGRMKDVKLLEGVGGGCSEEVLRVFNQMSEEIVWIPAKDKGKTVNLKYTLPVKFSL
jgi:TonB family protein